MLPLILALAALGVALVGVLLGVRSPKLNAPASGRRCAWWSIEVVGFWDEDETRKSKVYVDERSGPQLPGKPVVSFTETQSEGMLDDLKSGQTLSFGHYTFPNPPLSRGVRFSCREQVVVATGGRTAFAISGALGLIAVGALLGTEPEPRRARVALIGIDGGDWSVLSPLIESGEMPNLARFQTEGATAPLTISSAQSPDSWTTLASGHEPDVHGISQTGTTTVGGTFAATPKQVNVMRVWDMVGSSGRRVFVTNYWVTGPAYPIQGVMIPREPGEAFPEGADKRLEDWPPNTYVDDIQRLGLGLAKSGTTTWWLENEDFDLVILPYYGHDQGLHMLWQEFDHIRSGNTPELSPGELERAQTGYGIILETARLADRLVGFAMEAVGPEGFVVLVSDHGHTAAVPPTRRIAINRVLLDGQRGTLETGTVRTGTVTIELLAQERGQRSPLSTQLRYPVIELQGDDDGLVRTRLLSATTSTGEPLFREAGDRLVPSNALFARAESAVGRLEETNFSVFVNTGSHSTDEKGIFGVYGPGVKPGPIESEVRSRDVTPTVLWLMGLPAGEDQTGRPVTTVLENPDPPRFIDSYETGRRPWVTENPPGGLTTEEEEWLKSLGYL